MENLLWKGIYRMRQRRKRLTLEQKIKIISLLNSGVPVYRIMSRYKLKSYTTIARLKKLSIEDLIESAKVSKTSADL